MCPNHQNSLADKPVPEKAAKRLHRHSAITGYFSPNPATPFDAYRLRCQPGTADLYWPYLSPRRASERGMLTSHDDSRRIRCRRP